MKFACLVIVMVVPTFATAAPQKSDYHLGVEALTDFPIDVGAKVWAEFPYRLRVNTSIGVLPGGYVDVINGILVAADAYTNSDADLIQTALKSSLIWRIHVGWRPFKRR